MTLNGEDGGPLADPTKSVGWADVYRASSLEHCRARYQADPRRYEWLALGRGLDAKLGGRGRCFTGLRPEVEPEPMAPATVFILGASGGSDVGCMGHVSARISRTSLGPGSVAESSHRIDDPASMIERLIDRLVDIVRPLSPATASPDLEVVSPMDGVGDSHSLAVGIAVIHALVGAAVPASTAATGGFDLESGRFRPVAPSSLVQKAEAAARWGVRRILVVEGQSIPATAMPEGIEWIRIPADPAALPLQVLALHRSTATRGGDPGIVEAMRSSLAVFDMQVVRAAETSIETVFEVTAPFVADTIDDVADPVLAFLAADIRSRMLLHSGRSGEAADWNRKAIAFRGRGDLPQGLLGDHLLYEHPSHASMLALDLGVLDARGEEGRPHAELDDVIDDLDRRWCTRHQALLRLFARNTRWRRTSYLARWNLDPALLAVSESDLLWERDRWNELLSMHATDSLGMGNSGLSRQWNYVLEHLATEAALDDPERFVHRDAGPPPGSRDRFDELPGLLDEIRDRESDPDSLSSFDLRGLLQARWLRGEFDAEAAANIVRSRVPDVRWAEWAWRFGSEVDPSVVKTLTRSVVGHQQRSPGGVGRLTALRRAAMIDLSVGDDRWIESVVRPDGPATLVTAFDDLRSDPSKIIPRAPY